MSDQEETSGAPEKDFCVEIAKQGRATCKKCKEKCAKDVVRLAKLVHNPFADGKMKSWHHVKCLFELFLKQRPTTKRIKSLDDIDGFDMLPSKDQDELLEIINQSNKDIAEKYGLPAESPVKKVTKKEVNQKKTPNKHEISHTKSYPFKEFRRLVANISNVNAYTEKTQIVSDLFKNGKNGQKFEGDIHLWCRLLLPGVVKRIYNLQSKQLVKIFSRIFDVDLKQMLEHLNQGDVGETIQHFYEISRTIKPVKKSNLTVEQVDEFLEELSKLTKEEEQTAHFQSILKNCTSNDLKIIIRLIKHDLRMNAGAKHILDGIHPDAYEAYQSSRDLGSILQKCLSKVNSKEISANISVMTPVLPMLAEACKSVEMAMKKCPNGMYSEIKYDGERVQVHKKGSEFKYFSRSLKPVLQHKIAHFKDFIPQAFPSGNDLILDSEILMIDKETQNPLPFGSLGKHKRDEYENACVCLFVFDCIYYNGVDLTKEPIKKRKKILSENMSEVKNHIVFSESKIIHDPSDLKQMMIKVFKEGLEGLVLKDLNSVYEPGKRHWLKMKKDYLFDGAMADTADLIVLGAWYGTGKKGGKMSVFLMGCYDGKRDKFCTVTKVHTGIDDKTLDALQEQLQMIKINSAVNKVPDWLLCNRSMIPDFVAIDPKNQPVWEITGAEFTQHEVHTADGISIRFPRITKMRNDKDWKTATNLEELKTLYEKSKTETDVTQLLKDDSSEGTSKECSEASISPKKRNSQSNSSPNSSKGRSRSKTEIMKNDKDDSFGGTSKENLEASNSSTKHNNSSSKERSKRKSEAILSESPEKKRKKNDKSFPFLKDVKLFLEDEVKLLFEDWSQDLSTFSDIILGENEKNKATHVLHMNRFVQNINRSYPNNARHVVLDWLKDCVKNERLEDFSGYSVKWRTDL